MVRYMNGLSGFKAPVETGTTPDPYQYIYHKKQKKSTGSLRLPAVFMLNPWLVFL